MENIQNFEQKLETLSLLDKPLADQYTLLNLVYKIWNSTYSGMKNLELIIASMSKYMINQGRINPDTRRMREGRDMKTTLMETYKLWLKNGPMSPTCSTDEMYNFIRDHIPSKVSLSFVNDVMTKETFNEWIHDYNREYIRNLPANEGETSTGKISTMMDHSADKRCEERRKGNGQLNALFHRISAQNTNRISEHVSKLENGRWLTMECPGKIGSQLIRLHIYDVNNISNRNERPMLTKKQRYRFLCSSCTDRKQQLLRQLLDQVEDDLKNVPGIVQKSRKSRSKYL